MATIWGVLARPFIKDVLALANTPREDTAYIVFGVRWTPESSSVVVGLKRQFDDATLQDAIGRGRVQPTPRFTYYPLSFEGKQVGVLQIPVASDGPYTPIKGFPNAPSRCHLLSSRHPERSCDRH